MAAADALSTAIMAAAERFTSAQSTYDVNPKQKRLLYEFLAYPGRNGRTLSGRVLDGTKGGALELLYISRRWFGLHVTKHYYSMRLYQDALGIVLRFLQLLKREAVLPSSLARELDDAIAIGEQAAVQLPAIFRIVRMPCARNETYSRVYPLRPFPLCTVPAASEVKTSSSRHWPAQPEQVHHAWLSYASERCRVEVEELEAMVQALPKNVTIIGKTTGRWEIKAVNADSSVTFAPYKAAGEAITIPFHHKRAADILPGMVMIVTMVHLSDGSNYATDWGYVYPTYYAQHMDQEHDFGAIGNVTLVY